MLDDHVTIEKKKFSVGITALYTMIIFVVVAFAAYNLLKSFGLRELHTVAKGLEGASIELFDMGDGVVVRDENLPEGHVIYKDEEYKFNEDLIVILVMGIDKETVNEIGGQSWEAVEGSYLSGGQADALFLLLLDPHKKDVNMITINRNTMAEVDVWDEEGNYRGILTEQIALQHGYGDGGEESCLRQVKAVSRLFQGIPIHAYAAVSMDAIPEMNDAIGGVELEVLDDIIYPEYDMDLHKGDTVTLMGEKAYWYVRLRNENIFDSNSLRQERQRQYITALAGKAKEASAEDIRVAIELYQILEKYMTTDLNLKSYTYLASEAVNYKFDSTHMYSLEGQVMQGNRFEEFYPDRDGMQDLLIKLFYEKV